MTKFLHNQTFKTAVIFVVVLLLLPGSLSAGVKSLRLPDSRNTGNDLVVVKENTFQFSSIERQINAFPDDTTAFVCPEDISTYTDLNSCDALITSGLNIEARNSVITSLTWIMEGATTGQSPSAGVNQISSFVFNEGATIVTYQGNTRDNNSIHCTFTVTVSDNQVPRLIYSPGNITLANIPGECYAKVSWTKPIVSDNCVSSDNLIIHSSHTSGDDFPVGETEVEYRFSDGLNEVIHRFVVKVIDREKPELIAPEPIVIVCGEEVEDAFTTWAQFEQAGGKATDNCALNFSSFRYVSQTSSDIRCPYTITRTYSVADIHGNVSEVKRFIQVTGEEPEQQEEQEETSSALKSGMAVITSTGTGGDWNNGSTWVGGAVPQPTDDVVIASGATVTISGDQSCDNITINGTLEFSGSHTLNVTGSWTNDGNFNADSGTVQFSGSGASSIGGASTTVFKNFILDKGSLSDVLNINSDVVLNGGITFNSGLFQINSGNDVTCTGNSGFTVEALAGIYVNGGTFTGGSFSVIFKGLFQIDSGIASFGDISGNSILTQSSGTFDVNGGVINVAGRLEISGGTADISGGTVNLNQVGHNSSTIATLDLSLASDFNMTAGTINFLHPNGSGYFDVEIEDGVGGNKSISGGTFNFGDGSVDTYRILTDVDLSGSATTAANNTELEITQNVDSDGTYTFDLSDGNGNIIPVTITINASSYGSNASIVVTTTDGKFGDNASSINYLSRYWTVTLTDISNPNYDITVEYPSTDISGTETQIAAGVWTGSLPWIKGSATNSGANTITATGITESGIIFTGITLAAPTVTADATNTEICNGENINLTASGTGDPTLAYSWTGPNSFTSAVQNPTINNATTAASGTYTVTVTDGNGFTANDNVAITVNPTPDVTATPAAQTICSGTQTSISLSGTVPGTTFSWTVSSSSVGGASGGSGTSIAQTLTATGTSPGTATYTITPTANGCTGSSVNVIITVNPTPSVDDPGNQGLCHNENASAVTFSGTATSYNWTNNNTSIGLAANGTGNIASFTATNTGSTPQVATITVTPVYSNNGVDCSGTQETFTITVNPIPTVSASPPTQQICPGGTIAQINISNPNNVAGTTFSWTRNNTLVLTGINTSGSGSTISGTLNSTNPGVLETTTFTITATANGCSSQTTVDVVVGDNVVPTVASCPSDISVGTDGGSCSSVVTYSSPTFDDNCDGSGLTGTLVSGFASGQSFPVGTTTVTYEFSDAAGNGPVSCSFDVTVSDDEAPTVANCPIDISVGTDGGVCSAVVTYASPSFEDNCDGSGLTGTLVSGFASGQSFPVGTTTVTYEFTDASGNGPVSCSFDVTVSDDEAPTVANCPADISVSTDGGVCSAVVAYSSPTFNDNCDGLGLSGTLVSGFASGQSFPVGTTTVTYEFSDAAGNGPVFCSFDVTVSDDEAPVISNCPSDIIQSTDDGACEAIVNWTEPTAADNCTATGALTWTKSQAPGAIFSVGTTTVTYTATDAAGNVSAICSFDITITDDEAPIITCPIDVTVDNATGFCYATAGQVSPGTATATDNCNPNPGISGTRSDGLALSANYPVGTTTITWQATDGTNTSQCSQVITVNDVEKPSFTVPADITVYTDPSCNVNRLPAVTGTVPTTSKKDNCTVSANLVPAYTDGADIPGACTGSYSFERTWTLTDEYGNTESKTQIITVSDNRSPIVTAPADKSIKCYDDQDPYTNSALGVATATDNCTPTGSISIVYSDVITPGVCDTRYTITRTWTATDACGNFSTDVQTINVGDTEAPVVSMPDLSATCPSTIPPLYTVLQDFLDDGGTASDLCGPVTIEIIFENEISYGLEDKAGYCPDYLERTYRFTDPCGNYVDKIQTITVQDECGCTPCDDNTTFGWVDFLGDPMGDTTFYGVVRNGKCCPEAEYWQKPGNNPFRCVSYNVRIDDDAIGVQITIDAGAKPDVKEWLVDCENVSLTGPDGDIICLPSGGFHLFTYCKQGANPNDIQFGSVPGIIVSDDLTTRIDCQGQIDTEGDFTNPRWTSISPGAEGDYDQYLYDPLTMVPGSGVDVEDPIFIPDENSPAEIEYQVCADLGNYYCDAYGSNCDTINVYVKEKIEIELNIDPSMVCLNDPLDLVADVSPASSYYEFQWFDGPGGTGSVISSTNTVHFDPPVSLGTYSIRVTDYDPNGLMCNTAVFDFEVQADIYDALVFTPPAGDLYIECNSSTASQEIQDWLATATAEDDDGTPLDVTNDYSGIDHACGVVLPVTFSAIDDCGNTGTATANIIVEDNIDPYITQQPGDGNSDCIAEDPYNDAGFLNWLATRGGALAEDQCDEDLTWTDNSATQSWIVDLNNHTQSITVQWTVTDDCDNSVITNEATYTLIDDVPPVITCPVSSNAETDLFEDFVSGDGCTWTPSSVPDPAISDICGLDRLVYTLSGATTGDSPQTGFNYVRDAVLNLGITTVTYTLYDVAGNSATCAIRVWVKNIDDPHFTVTCPTTTSFVEEADPGVCETEVTIPAPSIDNFCVEVYDVSYQINSEAPVLVPAPAPVAGVTQLDPLVETFEVGTYTITWTITDASLNVHTCEITLEVQDTQDPTITCPVSSDPENPDLFEEFVSGDGCTWEPTSVPNPTFDDNCEVVAVTYELSGETTGSSASTGFNYVSSASLNLGVTTVTYTAWDAAGNASETCAIRIWIKNIDDPHFTVTCPPTTSFVEEADLGVCETEVTIPAPSIDNFCVEVYDITYQINSETPVPVPAPAPVAGVTQLDPLVETFEVGTYTITWTITDASLNVHTCEITLEVQDTQIPTITCPVSSDPENPDLFEEFVSGDGCEWAPTNVPNPTFDDNCEVIAVTYELSGETTGSSPSTGFNYVSSATLNLGVTTVTYTAWDAAGNASETCAIRIWTKNIDNPHFTVVCPTETSITVPAETYLCDAEVTVPAPSIDNFCVEVYDITYQINAEEPVPVTAPEPVAGVTNLDPLVYRFEVGTHIVRWTITDASLNVHTCDITVIVTDLNPYVNCPGPYVFDADYEEEFASGISLDPPDWGDNCPDSVLNWTLVPPTGYESYYTLPEDVSGEGVYPNPNSFYIGVTTITYTVTDANGNVATCDFTVTVRAKPDIECPPDTIVYLDGTEGQCAATFDPGIPDLIEGVPPITWTYTITYPDGTTETDTYVKNAPDQFADPLGDKTFPLGVTTIDWRAENVSGFDVCSHWIDVRDTIPPTFTTAPYEDCVDPLNWAIYNPTNPNPVYNHVDPNIEKNPVDYRTLFAGDTFLDLTDLDDNCCDPSEMTIHWRIEFSDTPDPNTGNPMSHPDVTGTGQPSEYEEGGIPTDIYLWGDGVTYASVTHQIFYWVEDCNGNTSEEIQESITITPRPQIIKENHE